MVNTDAGARSSFSESRLPYRCGKINPQRHLGQAMAGFPGSIPETVRRERVGAPGEINARRLRTFMASGARFVSR